MIISNALTIIINANTIHIFYCLHHQNITANNIWCICIYIKYFFPHFDGCRDFISVLLLLHLLLLLMLWLWLLLLDSVFVFALSYTSKSILFIFSSLPHTHTPTLPTLSFVVYSHSISIQPISRRMFDHIFTFKWIPIQAHIEIKYIKQKKISHIVYIDWEKERESIVAGVKGDSLLEKS